jgi:hypothetical protein
MIGQEIDEAAANRARRTAWSDHAAGGAIPPAARPSASPYANGNELPYLDIDVVIRDRATSAAFNAPMINKGRW